MKRIIPLVLVCVILVLSLAPAVSASESEPEFTEVLDFCFPNGTDNTKVYMRADGTLRTSFSWNVAWNIEYFDLIFTIPADRTCTGVKLGSGSNPANASALTVVNISGNMYRAYGHLPMQSRACYIWLEGTANWVTWHSVKVSTSALTGYDEKCQCGVLAYGFSDTINFNSADTINHRSFTGANDPTLNHLDLWLSCSNWRKYDYLDFWLQADCKSIDAITVTQDFSSIPYTLTYIDNGSSIENHYNFLVRLDLREVDRTGPDISVHIEGVVNQGSINLVGVLGCRGHVSVADLDKDVVWFRQIYLFLRDDFYFNIRTSLEGCLGYLQNIFIELSPSSSSGDAFKEESSDMISGLDDISVSMDSVNRPSMDSLELNFSGDISNASVLMSGLFTEVTSVPWLSTIILSSCFLGLLSYVLFGKE